MLYSSSYADKLRARLASGRQRTVSLLTPRHTTTTANSTAPTQSGRAQSDDIVENFLLIWLDAKIDESITDHDYTIKRLRHTVNTVEIFCDVEECLQYITQRKENEKIFFIVSGALCQSVVPRIHDTGQISFIYVFCGKLSQRNERQKDWKKVIGVFTDIDTICNSLQQYARQCEQDSIPISGVSTLNGIEPSFMYTQLLKEFIVGIEFDKTNDIKALVEFAREKYDKNEEHLKMIDEFARQYQGNGNQAVEWYSGECFTYRMLNKALGTLDVDTLLKMGFYMRDLHRNIKELHSEQANDNDAKVFRGKTMAKDNFEKTIKEGNLVSFNNFLSTSRDRAVAIEFIKKEPSPGNFRVLFVMAINRLQTSIPFADIAEFSKFPDEKEVLFSTHTVFRVQNIENIEESGMTFWQVELTLTASNDDAQLSELTEHMRTEIIGTDWSGVGHLIWKMGESEKCQQIYQTLLDKASNENEKVSCYNIMGLAYKNMGVYSKALSFHKEGVDILERALHPNHSSLATSYSNIGSVYEHMGEYSQALWFLEKARDIFERTLPQNSSDLAHCYNNIGAVYKSMREYSTGLSSYKKALELRQNILPPNHPDLAQSYNNIGYVYRKIGESLKALSFIEKALDIRQRALPPNHPLLAASYHSIGLVYDDMREYLRALSFYRKALDIRQRTLPPNHHLLAASYQNIGSVYEHLGEYSQALSFLEKARDIFERTLHPNYSSLAISYSNVGSVYKYMGQYSQALSFLEKARDIFERTLPQNSSDLAHCYNNIGSVYESLGEYSKGLSSYEKALEIYQNTLPPNDVSLIQCYSNIGSVYEKMGDYPAALSALQHCLEMFKASLSDGHLDYANSYSVLGRVHRSMEDYPMALSFFQKTLDIQKTALPENHPYLALTYSNIGDVHRLTGEYKEAIELHQKALGIYERIPSNPDLATCYSNVGCVHRDEGNFSKALECYEKALQIRQKFLPDTHPDLLVSITNVEQTKQKV